MVPMKFKFIRCISYTKQIKIFVTSLFIFSFTYAKAQTSSYTQPSLDDLRLANKAVSSCKVLQDVISKNSQTDDIPAIKAFIELQKTEDGNLLIDNEACRESILEFVSSLCTSNSSKNNLYCESLGIKKSYDNGDTRIDESINDYKKFGQLAIDNLGVDLSDDISFESRLDEQDQSKLKFLAAGTLFSLSPVKKLRVASFIGKNAATRVKPVLNGALLVLATLGLSSCNDATDPTSPPSVGETPCARNQAGYFQLSDTDSECIKLPSLAYSFLTSAGEESTTSNSDPDTIIKIKFDSEVVFINNDGFSELTQENALEMLEIKKNNTETDLTTQDGPINQENISITQENSNTVITISPPNSSNGKIYHAGDYSILTKNYAKKLDAAKVQQSSSTNAYLENIKQESSFSVTVDSPCTRAENGYFYFRNADGTARCENLIPNVTYTFSSNNDPQATLEINFDPDIVYVDETGWSEIDNNNILDMLAINPVDTDTDTDTDVDYEVNTDDLLVKEGPIDLEQISITRTNTGITITIEPPNTGLDEDGYHQVGLYQTGDYTVSATNYIKRSDMDILIQNNVLGNYLDAVKDSSVTEFSIDAVASLACGAGYSSQAYMPIDSENQEPSFCGAYVPYIESSAMGMNFNNTKSLGKKADPNTTYVIDIGFVLSSSYPHDDGWSEFIKDEVIPNVNDIYQRSGVNVEFRAVAVVPFQRYKHYLYCQLDTIDSSDDWDAMWFAEQDLIPVMRKHYGSDLLYIIRKYPAELGYCGLAPVRTSNHPVEDAKQYVATGSVDTTCASRWVSVPSFSHRIQHYVFITTLAHELGHNLGLKHNRESLYSIAEDIFHPTGYGYRGEAGTIYGDSLAYGTIMAVSVHRVPFLGSNRAVSTEELCADRSRFDRQLDYGFCSVNDNYFRLSHEQIPLGSKRSDSVEALQYTIEDASKYHCSPGSC